MTLQGDNIQHWCKEESLSVVIERDDDEALVCTISVAAQPPLSIGLRSQRRDPARTELSSTFELQVPEEMAGGEQGRPRMESLLERVAAGRSALLDCRLLEWSERPSVEVVAVLHGDDFTKQGFLTTLAEIEKVHKIITWELETVGLAASMISEMQSRVGGIVGEADKLASQAAQAAKAAEELQVPAALEEAPPPAAEPGPPPSPPPTAEAAPTPAARFCPSCGRQAKKEHRFCIGCGSSLDG